MLLYKHNQHLQGYNNQSSSNGRIKELLFKG